MLAKARELPIPTPWNRDEFIASIAEMRSRKIHLIPTPIVKATGSPCGLWLVRPHDDVILYDPNTTDYHIDQIVRHEIGHMILEHDLAVTDPSGPQEGSGMFSAALPDIELDAIREVLGQDDKLDEVSAVLQRSDFANDQEREAETFASLIMWAGREKEKSRPRPMMRSVFFPNER
jgi:hypothetical protein